MKKTGKETALERCRRRRRLKSRLPPTAGSPQTLNTGSVFPLGPIGLERGLKDPEAIRAYKIFFGSETAMVVADSDSPVVKAIQGIYDNCVKG